MNVKFSVYICEMETKDRILEIMENSGLTPSEFAEKIEAPRSSISHIISGRNNPSLDFIIKIKNAFPEIDTDWLIFGNDKKAENTIPDALEFDAKKSTTKIETPHPTLFDFTESEEKTILQEEDPPPYILNKQQYAERKILRAVLFFDDGTFEDFIPKTS